LTATIDLLSSLTTDPPSARHIAASHNRRIIMAQVTRSETRHRSLCTAIHGMHCRIKSIGFRRLQNGAVQWETIDFIKTYRQAPSQRLGTRVNFPRNRAKKSPPLEIATPNFSVPAVDTFYAGLLSPVKLVTTRLTAECYFHLRRWYENVARVVNKIVVNGASAFK